MSELDAVNQVMRETTQLIRQTAEAVRDGIDRTAAQSAGRDIEADGRAEQRELLAGHRPEAAAAQPEYHPGADLPPQAQTDAPWTFGEPPAAQFSGSFDWADLGTGPERTP